MIHVVEYQPVWAAAFEAEAARIMEAVGKVVQRVHHIGSTSIPQSMAKPIIDILLEATSLDALDRKAPMLVALGYEAKGEYGIPGRRYFRLDGADGTRTHQVHAFEVGSANVLRHVAFRDYMRANPVLALEYGVLKQRLAERFPHDTAAYVGGKDAFVKAHERRAILWTGG